MANGTAGAPQGNSNASTGKRWLRAINQALDKRSKAAGIDALNELAEKLLAECDAGNLGALVELGNRLDGKPIQMIEGTGENGSITLSMLVQYATTSSDTPPKT